MAGSLKKDLLFRFLLLLLLFADGNRLGGGGEAWIGLRFRTDKAGARARTY